MTAERLQEITATAEDVRSALEAASIAMIRLQHLTSPSSVPLALHEGLGPLAGRVESTKVYAAEYTELVEVFA
jgi:hypothetical protein